MLIKKEDLLRIILKIDEYQEDIEVDSIEMFSNPTDGRREYCFNNLIIKGCHENKKLVETIEEVSGKKNV